MVHSLPQERWREKRPEPTEPTFSISRWSRTNVLRPESVGITSLNYPHCLPSANCNFLSQFGSRGCHLSPIAVVYMIIFLIFIIIFVVTHYHHHRQHHGMVVGRVIPWPASDPSLDSVELCHENQHCAPFADSLYHHHHQDFQFKGVLDVYSR